MISRRQIIRAGQQEPAKSHQPPPAPAPSQQQQQAPSSASSGSSSSKPSSRAAGARQPGARAPGPKAGPRKPVAGAKVASEQSNSQQQDSSDGYVVASSNPYEDYVDDRGWRQQQQQQQQARRQEPAGYHHFDPYSIYSEEEDVWYSEERLFEDHLDEIYNKWPLLDDDIWCKLIIMERNRRIGKAYARVPIVTIDGSHELSYDGYKLALNGFDNPDRDGETEDCRKRIGKGIRIKMDNFGNILIKRLSKSGVYIKEWINPTILTNDGSSNSTNGASGGRAMPSRQQLIKNQNALLAAAMNGNGGTNRLGSQISSLTNSSGTPTSSSGGSSMDPPNDSAVCDEVVSVGGRLDLDKIYVMFDMKKFQANITQELCRSYPDRRKLEQQCFSIVGLSRDNDDILNLPCWVMVINIVAIEMLNERFPMMSSHTAGFPDTMLSDTPGNRHVRPPNFVSIFDNHTVSNNKNIETNKEEDPYSLPANASSSDVKSSINDYGTTSTKNVSSLMDSNGRHMLPSRYYGASKIYQCKGNMISSSQQADVMRHRSKSNYDIYGPCSKIASSRQERYNSSSIYSPGHMLVPTSGDLVPPKLPPRDFVKKGKSKSSSNVSCDQKNPSSSKFDSYDTNENIYSTGIAGPETTAMDAKVVRKAKKNRFLESLKAPLELAKSNRSASVVDAPVSITAQQQTLDQVLENNISTKKNSSKSKGGFTKSSAKNLKSFLGVGGKSTKETTSDENSYVHVDNGKPKRSTKIPNDNGEADSVVDSNEEVDDGQQVIANSSTSSAASYNDLDIPTPDYETDENIYALEENGGNLNNQSNNRGRIYSSKQKDLRTIIHGKSLSATAYGGNKNNKDDLYYSGFRAHIPKNATSSRPDRTQNGKLLHADDKISCISSSARETSRYLIHTSRMISSKLSGREMVYGSTTGLPASATGSRYRSASMQRLYPRTSQVSAHRSQNEMYDLETENPYAMSGDGGLASSTITAPDDSQGHYGIAGGGGHRRRSSSKLAPNLFTSSGGGAGALNRVASSMANTNYDIGRSSSGIYGNNSGSSSSDYADWHPQVRKVNSSGYLNSIFKHHHQQPNSSSQMVDSFDSINPLNNHNSNNNNKNNNSLVHGYNNNINSKPSQPQVRNHTSRTLKSMGRALSKQQQQHSQNQTVVAHVHQVASSVGNGPTYPSYDSSNDSEPSYTNSSDGLDIYDQIGAHSRLNHHHFMNHAHNLAPEVHVGEWENMYDR